MSQLTGLTIEQVLQQEVIAHKEGKLQEAERPKMGDIILFPSSLFHRTIPFNMDAERCVIAFDLIRQLP